MSILRKDTMSKEDGCFYIITVLNAHCCLTGMQTLVNRVVVSPLWGGTAVLGLLLLHETWLLWSSLPRADTCALYQLFTWAVLPAIKAASAPSLGRRLTRSNSVRS